MAVIFSNLKYLIDVDHKVVFNKLNLMGLRQKWGIIILFAMIEWKWISDAYIMNRVNA